MKHEKSCGCIVVNEKNEVLLVHSNKGHWGFPKGHVEDGETEEQTAIREVKEETGIDVEINKKNRYTQTYNIKEEIEKEVVYFLAQNINNEIQKQVEEVSEVKWFSFEEAMKIITYDNSKQILFKIKKEIFT